MEEIIFAKKVVEFLLNFIPHETLKDLIDEQAKERARLAADAAEAAKFAP